MALAPLLDPPTEPPVAAAPAGAPVAVLFGSTSGRTEELALQVAARLSARLGEAVPVQDVATTDLAFLKVSEFAILGVPTWHVGELQADWDAVVDDLAAMDLRGLLVALFGAGDAAGYPDTFGDALGIVAEAVENAGATVVGHVPADAYAFEASRARRGDRLVGLLVDDRDDEPVARDRIDRWCRALPLGPGRSGARAARSRSDRSS